MHILKSTFFLSRKKKEDSWILARKAKSGKKPRS